MKDHRLLSDGVISAIMSMRIHFFVCRACQLVKHVFSEEYVSRAHLDVGRVLPPSFHFTLGSTFRLAIHRGLSLRLGSCVDCVAPNGDPR